MIDWAQTLTILGGVGAMWYGCFTILREDMKEMDARWDKRSAEMENRHREDLKTTREDMNKNESHWRELFMYMNNKIDNVSQKPNNNKDS